MSRNFTTDVDTQREYFNAQYNNNSGLTQIARYEADLLKPFFNDPDKWKLAINRMRIPLAGIPLTKNNIPFEQWQVGMEYRNNGGTSIVDDFEYVPQFNQKLGFLSSIITTKDNLNNVSLLEGQPIKGLYVDDVSQALASGTLLITGNSTYVATAVPSSQVVTVYRFSKVFILTQTINTTYPVLAINMDIQTNNLYICENNPAGVVTYVASYSNNSWNLVESGGYETLDNTLTVLGIQYINGYFYLGATNNLIYQWSGGGSSSLKYSYSDQFILSVLGQNNNKLLAGYIPIKNPIPTDIIYANNNNDNNNVYQLPTYGPTIKKTYGTDIISQTAVRFPDISGNATIYGIGLDTHLHKQPYPPNDSLWTLANTTIAMKNLFIDDTTNQVYGIAQTTGDLYGLNWNGKTDDSWIKLIPSYNASAVSMAYDRNTKQLISTASDGSFTNSNTIFYPRVFFTTAGSGLQKVGVKNNYSNPSTYTFEAEQQINQNISVYQSLNYTPMTTDGNNIYVSDPAGLNVIIVNSNDLQQSSSFNVPGSQGALGLNYGSKSGKLYISSLYLNPSTSLYENCIYICDVNGLFQSLITTTIVGDSYPCACAEITDGNILNTYLATEQDLSGNINIYNVNNPASPVLFTTIATNLNIDVMVFNPNDIENGAGVLYILGSSLPFVPGTPKQIFKVSFTDNTYQTLSAVVPITTYATTAYTIKSLTLSYNMNEFYVLKQSTTTSQNYLDIWSTTSNNIFIGTVNLLTTEGPTPSNTIISLNNLSNPYSQTPTTSNLQIQSIATSKVTTDKYYALDNSTGILYTGTRSGSTFNFTSFRNYNQLFQNISVIYKNVLPPTQTTTQIVSFPVGILSPDSVIDSGVDSVAYLASNSSNQIVFSQSNSNIIKTLGGTDITVNTTSVLNYIVGPQTPIEAGAYEIYTYQDFLNQINSAFQTSFNNLKTQLGALFLPTEPPSIIYNAQTRLFSLVCEGQYLTQNADGTRQYKILMNQGLWNQFFFPSSNITINNKSYKSLILQNYGTNAVVGTGSASIPQFIYIVQEDSTIYAFYDLVRIIVGTTRIPVSGDGEGRSFTNSGSSTNASVNMITDIIPDTTTLTPGTILIYIPAGILRWYNLYAQQPFQKIDLTLEYETKDGNIYPIPIPDGEFFSVKMEFKKGPGDF